MSHDEVAQLSLLAAVLVAGDIAADHNNQRACRYFRKGAELDTEKAVADAAALLKAAEEKLRKQ